MGMRKSGTFQAAFYKGKGLLYNKIIRAWEGSPYSHGELVFSDGMWGSSSYQDKGVRLKRIKLNPDHWDFVWLPPKKEAAARAWFELHHKRMKYDLTGQIRFVVPALRFWNNNNKAWCTEAMAIALGMPEPWQYGPRALHASLTNIADYVQSPRLIAS